MRPRTSLWTYNYIVNEDTKTGGPEARRAAEEDSGPGKDDCEEILGQLAGLVGGVTSEAGYKAAVQSPFLGPLAFSHA